MLPNLTYDTLEVQDGTIALDTWGRMVLVAYFEENKEEVRKNLLAYCELDTLSMVEIYRILLYTNS